MRNPVGAESPLWSLPCNLTRTDGGLDVALEDQGAPGVVCGPSSPIRKGQREARLVPGAGLGSVSRLPALAAVASTAVAGCQSKGQCYPPSKHHRRWRAPTQAEARDPDGVECVEAANEPGGPVRLPAARSGNRGPVTAETVCSSAHGRQEGLAWRWPPLCWTPA